MSEGSDGAVMMVGAGNDTSVNQGTGASRDIGERANLRPFGELARKRGEEWGT